MKRLVISLLTIFVLSGCIRTLEGNTQKTLEQFLENGGRDVYSLDVDDEVQNQVAEVSSYELIELLEISEGSKDIREYTREDFESGLIDTTFSTFEELQEELISRTEERDMELVEHNKDTILIDYGNTLYDVSFKYEIESENYDGEAFNGTAMFTVQATYETKNDRYKFSTVEDVVFD
ncbi:hypothetical protein [Shouchella miscanthi]|uniref:hypothetical protein n=1 Tax=Shouchella miscanthi TaxID=2598861 RepID=UPI0011A7C788|nr:hypothetical protein [Shouchella miscanthi]